MKSNRAMGRNRASLGLTLPLLDELGRITIPSSATAHSQPVFMNKLGKIAAEARGVVVTATANMNAMVALTFTLAGTVQVAPTGAPVQLNVAVPLNPAPPMVSL